jgi:hypothetical protein
MEFVKRSMLEGQLLHVIGLVNVIIFIIAIIVHIVVIITLQNVGRKI